VARAQYLRQAGVHEPVGRHQRRSPGPAGCDCACGNFIHADFGYGTPNQEFRSTHKLQRRGKLLLCRRYGVTSLLFRLHGVQDRMNESLIGRIKAVRKRLKERRWAA
jgi:hypothetical protein